MLKSLNIRKKLLALILVAVALSGLLTILVSVYALGGSGSERVRAARERMLTARKEKLQDLVRNATHLLQASHEDTKDPKRMAEQYKVYLKSLVDVAYNAVKSIDENPRLSGEQKKALALRTLKDLRYRSNDYFWVNDMQPRMVMHPIKPELDGSDLSTYKDPNGKFLFNEFVSVCRQNGEGFVDYMWPKPGFEKPVPKLSFVKLYRPYGWVIGSGIYMEAAEEAAKENAKATIADLRYGPEGKDYFWINDMHPTMVMHPFKPELNGKDLTDYKDPNGKQLFVEFAEVCKKNGEGFVEYMWPKPGFDKPVPKLSYVKLYPEWGWVVGTGLYLDDIDVAMEGIQRDVNRTIFAEIGKQAGITFLLVLGLGFVGYYVAGNLIRPIQNTNDILRDISEGEGDLTRRIEVTTKDELGAMASSFNTFVGSIHDIVQNTQADASALKNSSAETDTLSKDLSTRANHLSQQSAKMAGASREVNAKMTSVAATVEQATTNLGAIAAAAEQMTSTISTISKNTDKASGISRSAVNQAHGANQRINDLGKAAKEIEAVTETITEISEQTKLLALNATIEAARAGEAGKGFAVVAGEIKELARQTASATGEISRRIEGMQSSTELTIQEISRISQVISEMDAIVSEIARSMDEQSRSATEIAASVSEASLGMQEVSRNVAAGSALTNQISSDIDSTDRGASEIAGWAERLKNNAENLNNLASRLNEVMGRFKV